MEMVQIHLWSLSDKIGLKNQIEERIKQQGLGECIGDLDLAFELGDGWPVSSDSEITLTQLVVICRKLKMTINITRLSLEPLIFKD